MPYTGSHFNFLKHTSCVLPQDKLSKIWHKCRVNSASSRLFSKNGAYASVSCVPTNYDASEHLKFLVTNRTDSDSVESNIKRANHLHPTNFLTLLNK